jgi:hypothetical protein
MRPLRRAIGDLQKHRLLDGGEKLRPQKALQPEEVLKTETAQGNAPMRIIVSCGFGLALLGMLAIEAAAQQSSCSEVLASCLANGGGGVCSERPTIASAPAAGTAISSTAVGSAA